MPLVTRVGACEIQRLHCAVMRLVCLERVLVESHPSSMQEGLPVKRNDATYVCLERVLVELSVYMGNGCC